MHHILQCGGECMHIEKFAIRQYAMCYGIHSFTIKLMVLGYLVKGVNNIRERELLGV